MIKPLIAASVAIVAFASPTFAATAEQIKDCETVQNVKWEANEILWEARLDGHTDIAIKAQQLIQDSEEFIETHCYAHGIY